MKAKIWECLAALTLSLACLAMAGCGTSKTPEPNVLTPELSAPTVPPSLEEIPISLSPSVTDLVPDGARIVIANISGECADEVKDALVRRLIDNTNYNILARDYLKQIILENEGEWAGDFNTETATKLGRLLGASLWIVGKVTFCGKSLGENIGQSDAGNFTIDASLQIIDLETREVLVSSFSQGSYSKPLSPFMNSEPVLSGFLRERKINTSSANDSANSPNSPPSNEEASAETQSSEAPKDPQASASALQPSDRVPVYRSAEEAKRFRELGIKARPAVLKAKATRLLQRKRDNPRTATKNTPERYEKNRAADDLANKFADKFFSRPFWELVQMWQSDDWLYSKAIAYVQLGQCPLGVRFLTNEASKELDQLSKEHLSNYLHNLGVTLLCSNRIDEAKEKLRSAYRVENNLATLRMLGLASKISEWQLSAEVDKSPEIQQLFTAGPPSTTSD